MNGDDIYRETSGRVNETMTTNTKEERAIMMRKYKLAQEIEDNGGATNQMTTRTADIASTTAGIATEMTTSITEGTGIALGAMEAKNESARTTMEKSIENTEAKTDVIDIVNVSEMTGGMTTDDTTIADRNDNELNRVCETIGARNDNELNRDCETCG